MKKLKKLKLVLQGHIILYQDLQLHQSKLKINIKKKEMIEKSMNFKKLHMIKIIVMIQAFQIHKLISLSFIYIKFKKLFDNHPQLYYKLANLVKQISLTEGHYQEQIQRIPSKEPTIEETKKKFDMMNNESNLTKDLKKKTRPQSGNSYFKKRKDSTEMYLEQKNKKSQFEANQEENKIHNNNIETKNKKVMFQNLIEERKSLGSDEEKLDQLIEKEQSQDKQQVKVEESTEKIKEQETIPIQLQSKLSDQPNSLSMKENLQFLHPETKKPKKKKYFVSPQHFRSARSGYKPEIAPGNLSAKLSSPSKINNSKLTSYENKGLLKKLMQNAQTMLQQPSLDQFVKKMVHANAVSQKIFDKKKVQFEQSLQINESPEKNLTEKKSPRKSTGINIVKKKKKNEKKLGNKSEL